MKIKATQKSGEKISGRRKALRRSMPGILKEQWDSHWLESCLRDQRGGELGKRYQDRWHKRPTPLVTLGGECLQAVSIDFPACFRAVMATRFRID